MNRSFATTICSAAALSIAVLCSTAAIAQQKTEKECRDEWRSQKAAMQAAGTTEKAYVEKCHTTAGAAPAAEPSKPVAAAPTGDKKTVKACEDEWRAQKAAMQQAGKTEKAYVAECRGGAATAQPTAAPAPTAVTPAPAPAPAAAARPAPPPTTAAKPAAAPASGTPSGAGQFATEAQAKAQCPTDTVVWVNLNSDIYHYNGTKDYGTTKKGAYMCERNTAAAGFRASKAEKHP